MRDTQSVEIRIKLQEKQKEAYKKSLVTPVLFYGGAKGGGKSFLIRAKEISLRLQHPKTKGLIIRKTLPELRANHIQQMFKEYPILSDWYNKSEKIIYYPNGSTTEFSYLQSTDDVYTYQGREYENISIDEITQHDEEVFKILRTSLRTTTENYKTSMLLTGNPGGRGHAWVKRVFVDKLFRPEEDPTDFDFVQAKVTDNKLLMERDPKYVKNLYDLPEHLRKAYLDGDWNIFAGQAFSELSESVHIIDPVELPRDTVYFAGYDHGYNHPFAFVLFALVPDGTVYVVGKYSSRLLNPEEIAQGIREHVGDKKLVIYAGTDLWSKQRDGRSSVYEQFYAAGMKPPQFTLIQAFTDREQGVSQIRKFITYKNKPDKKPHLYFFKNTIDVFNVVASMQFDPKKPEDVVKVDADENGEGGDDAYDAFRYGLMGRSYAAKPKQQEKHPFQGDVVLELLQLQNEYEEEVSEYE